MPMPNRFPFAQPQEFTPFVPPKKVQAERTKYIIGGRKFWLISDDELKREITQSTVEGAMNRKHAIMQKATRELEEMKKEYDKQSTELIQAEWDARAKEFNTKDSQQNFMKLLSFMLAVTSRVLIEKFGWKPIGTPFRWTKTAKFSDYVAEEISKICEDEHMDIRKYSDETYDLYGVKFEFSEE